jgi:hypothetical protein
MSAAPDLRNNIIAYLVAQLGGKVEIPYDDLESPDGDIELYIDKCNHTMAYRLAVRPEQAIRLADTYTETY